MKQVATELIMPKNGSESVGVCFQFPLFRLVSFQSLDSEVEGRTDDDGDMSNWFKPK